MSFRPLTGIMVLIEQKKYFRVWRKQYVSVPLRGLWFLSAEQDQAVGPFPLRFPSPYGDYGSYLYREKVDDERLIGLLVSVPLRGLWFLSAASSAPNKRRRRKGFRPLTGIMVLIVAMAKARTACRQDEVSVPLRGLWFLSITLGDMMKQSYIAKFPSPYGDYGSYPHPL